MYWSKICTLSVNSESTRFPSRLIDEGSMIYFHLHVAHKQCIITTKRMCLFLCIQKTFKVKKENSSGVI